MKPSLGSLTDNMFTMRLIMLQFAFFYAFSTVMAVAAGNWGLALSNLVFEGGVYMIWRLIRHVILLRRTVSALRDDVSHMLKVNRAYEEIALAANRNKMIEQLTVESKATWS